MGRPKGSKNIKPAIKIGYEDNEKIRFENGRLEGATIETVTLVNGRLEGAKMSEVNVVPVPVEFKKELEAAMQDDMDDLIPVKNAFLHQSITWPGVAGAEKTMAKIHGAKIYWAPYALVIECKGQTCLVPHANVANAILF